MLIFSEVFLLHLATTLGRSVDDIFAAMLSFYAPIHNFFLPIKNKQGKIVCTTLVDKEVYEYMINNKHTVRLNANGYVCTTIDNKDYVFSRYIFYVFYKNIPTPGCIVDHVKSNKMDNMLKSLREITRAQNSANKTKKSTTSTSKYHGVSKAGKEWQCDLKHDGVHYYFRYKDELHAAWHYNVLVKELQTFSKLNDIEKPDHFVLRIKPPAPPRNIYKDLKNDGQYFCVFNGKRTYGFNSIQEAADGLAKLKKEKVLSEPMKVNNDGIAIIEMFNRKKEKTGEIMVDHNDYYDLKQYSWYIDIINGQERVKGHLKICGNVQLGRFLMKCTVGDNTKVDHVDSNTKNFQRANLRVTNAKGNAENRSSNKNSTSKYVGVSFDRDRNKWMSQIKNSGKIYVLGRFNDEIDAAKARDKKAIEFNSTGGLYKLNFP